MRLSGISLEPSLAKSGRGGDIKRGMAIYEGLSIKGGFKPSAHCALALKKNYPTSFCALATPRWGKTWVRKALFLGQITIYINEKSAFLI